MVAFSQRAPAVMADARHEPNWGEMVLLFTDVPGPGRDQRTLELYAAEPRDWDQSEISALQAYAGVVASLLAAAGQAQVKGSWLPSCRWPWRPGC